MVRVAVLGAGDHSTTNHGPSLRDIAARDPGAVELAAVCDLARDRAERYATRFGFARVYTDLREMVKRETPDAVVAVTPVPMTRSIVGELLGYGIPLLIEKPPGLDEREARELLEIASRHSTPHMVSFNRRFVPALQKARAWLAERSDGARPGLIVARMLRNRRLEPEFITGTAIHLVDAVLSFTGAPVAFTHHRWTTSAGGQSCDARLVFADGSTALLVIAPDAGMVDETYELIGPDYTVRIDTLNCAVTAERAGRRELDWRQPEGTPTHMLHGCLEETEAFLSAVSGRSPYFPTLEQGLLSVTWAHRLNQMP
jgi:predicted dehydrogenase